MQGKTRQDELEVQWCKIAIVYGDATKKQVIKFKMNESLTFYYSAIYSLSLAEFLRIG